MKPGIYDISNEEYHNGPGISRSGIMELQRCPRHFWNRYIRKDKLLQKSNDAKDFGSAFHMYVLEPDIFDREFYLEERKLNMTKNADKAERKRFAEENPGRKLVTFENFKKIQEMKNSIMNDEVCYQLIKNGLYEKTIYWKDPDTGVLCKCRPDILHPNLNIACDLKTTNDASNDGFYRSVFSYSYHIQAAMICDGFFHVFGREMKEEDFIFICVETEEPYCTSSPNLSKEDLEKGRIEYKKQLLIYKECLEKNEWPSYEPLQTISRKTRAA